MKMLLIDEEKAINCVTMKMKITWFLNWQTCDHTSSSANDKMSRRDCVYDDGCGDDEASSFDNFRFSPLDFMEFSQTGSHRKPFTLIC